MVYTDGRTTEEGGFPPPLQNRSLVVKVTRLSPVVERVLRFSRFEVQGSNPRTREPENPRTREP